MRYILTKPLHVGSSTNKYKVAITIAHLDHGAIEGVYSRSKSRKREIERQAMESVDDRLEIKAVIQSARASALYVQRTSSIVDMCRRKAIGLGWKSGWGIAPSIVDEKLQLMQKPRICYEYGMKIVPDVVLARARMYLRRNTACGGGLDRAGQRSDSAAVPADSRVFASSRASFAFGFAEGSSTLLACWPKTLVTFTSARSRPSGESQPSPSPSQAHTLAFEHLRTDCSLPRPPRSLQSPTARPFSIIRALVDAISHRQDLLVLLRLRRSPVCRQRRRRPPTSESVTNTTRPANGVSLFTSAPINHLTARSELTLTQAPATHYSLDYRQRHLISPNQRYLPPPRPSSNLSNGQYQALPARTSSNISTTQQFAPPPRAQSGMSNGYSNHGGSQSRAGAEYAYTGGPTQQASHEDLRRRGSRAGQTNRPYPESAISTSSRAAPVAASAAQMPPHQSHYDSARAESSERSRRRARRDVDWVEYFGGKPPTEIITIHDDDSPAPPASAHKEPQVPATNGSYAPPAQHVDKRRRVNGGAADVPAYGDSRTPYSYSNGTSTESLQNTTAPTSLGSSTSSRLEPTQTGQKRKRTTRTSEQERKKQEVERLGPRGYLAEYGEYVPPPKQHKKQREVAVPVLHDRYKNHDKIDDEDGHYIVQEGSSIGNRYNLVNLLGQGTFGKVVRARDSKNREFAVKIIRAVPKYRDASRIELRVLQTLRQADSENRNRCIQLMDCFDWRGHICIVTPLLGLSVFDFLKSGGFVPFPGSHIQAFARQLLGSIAFLHDLNLVHTDLKPENILLINHTYQTFTYNRNIPSSSTLTARSAKFRRVLLAPQINLIDFGSATFDDEYHSSVVSTRHYRAPEIILGIGWNHPIDLWSLGCILVECWTGDALFQTHDCAEHLAMMEAVTGNQIDKSLIREVMKQSKRSDRNSAARFFKNQHLAYPFSDTPRQSRKFVRAMKRLEEIIPPTTQFNKLFLDLLRKIFVYDPKKRITAREALKHPWFSELVEDDGTEAGRIRVERERQRVQGERDAERGVERIENKR
ncbi:hypothetical protein Q7P37_011022 [Cladosporium fusiforme]